MGIKRIIRNSFCELLATLLVMLGFANKAKKRSFQPNVITSVVFHNPGKKLFNKVVVWLKKNGYVFLSSDQLIQILSKEITCPRGAVWISLDDGWRKNLDNVIPTVVQHNVPITIFVCTHAVEDGTYWWRKVRQAPHLLPSEFQNTEAIRELPDNRRKEILKSYKQTSVKFIRETLTVEDIRNISSISQVTLGAHTATHPVLPNCTESELEYEFTESRAKLEGWVGKPVTTFAYPNGVFDGRERHFLEKCGYELAATTESGFVIPDSDRYLIPRSEIVDNGGFTENICHILGIWQPLVKKFKRVVGKG